MTETEITERFIAALHALERDHALDPLVALFAAESEIGNLVSPRTFAGPDGAREFWRSYRANFGEVASKFRNVIVSDGRAALEWTSVGTGADGEPFTYSGVSILEFGDDQIARFWAYFDPHDLGRQIEG
ncbi:MAG: nuclear transport factor 2 family protein [Thermomicrobiales bacterium]